jgi:hypothetical protein
MVTRTHPPGGIIGTSFGVSRAGSLASGAGVRPGAPVGEARRGDREDAGDGQGGDQFQLRTGHGVQNPLGEYGDGGRDRHRRGGVDRRDGERRRDGGPGVVGQQGGQPGSGQRHPATGEALAEQLPGLRQPGGDRPLRAANLPGRLVVGLAAQVAEDDRGAVLGREPADLLVEDRPQVVPHGRGGGVGRWHRRRPPLAGLAPGTVGSGVGGDPAGDPVQPRPDRDARPEGRGLAGEHQEGGLEGVLRVVGVAEQPPTDAEHHRPVAGDQLGERRGVGPPGEPVEQLGIGRLVRRVDRPAQPPQERPDGLAHGHPARIVCGHRIMPRRGPALFAHPLFSRRPGYLSAFGTRTSLSIA